MDAFRRAFRRGIHSVEKALLWKQQSDIVSPSVGRYSTDIVSRPVFRIIGKSPTGRSSLPSSLLSRAVKNGNNSLRLYNNNFSAFQQHLVVKSALVQRAFSSAAQASFGVKVLKRSPIGLAACLFSSATSSSGGNASVMEPQIPWLDSVTAVSLTSSFALASLIDLCIPQLNQKNNWKHYCKPVDAGVVFSVTDDAEPVYDAAVLVPLRSTEEELRWTVKECNEMRLKLAACRMREASLQNSLRLERHQHQYEQSKLLRDLERASAEAHDALSSAACVICLDHPRNVTYNCGHHIICEACDIIISRSSNQCALCRAPITRRQRHFVT